MLYFICPKEPIRRTKHLRGTQKSEPPPKVDINHFQFSIDIPLGIAFSVHGTMLFFSALSLSCAPAAHWDAYLHFLVSDSAHPHCVRSATTVICGIIVALDSSEP